MRWDVISVFVVLCLAVAIIGFLAARWMRGDLDLLHEWGLAGRRFGTVISWFLMGGDLYTAYTFVAVPALVFGTGAYGMFALPYSIIAYPLVYLFLPKLWQVARNRGYITASDFVKDRFDSRLLALVVAVTGIVATMPYVALQIFGIAVVINRMGINEEVALVVAFLVLAVFTYTSGLRAPALIAIIKDTLIWIVVIACIIIIPAHLGGYGAVFAKVPAAKLTLPSPLYAAYATVSLGSAFALFLYPHAITGTLASKGRKVIQRNMALLPAYAVMLGLIAILGYMAIAAGVKPVKPYGANSAIPQLLEISFPGWFTGFAFAAIAIGALVPASVMSIAAANLFNRNIYREFFRPNISDREETRVSQITSLVVKLGGLAFVAFGASQYAINLQLAGGVWMSQTLPAVFLALYVKWLDRWAVLAGWVVGIGLGTYWLIVEKFQATLHTYPIGGPAGTKLYIGLVAVVLNLAVVVVWSLVANLVRGRRPAGLLEDEDYQPVIVSGS